MIKKYSKSEENTNFSDRENYASRLWRPLFPRLPVRITGKHIHYQFALQQSKLLYILANGQNVD